MITLGVASILVGVLLIILGSILTPPAYTAWAVGVALLVIGAVLVVLGAIGRVAARFGARRWF